MLRLAWPVLVEQILFMMVGLVDLWLTGKYLEERHLAAIGLMSYVLWLIPCMFGMVGIGATALTARFVGGGDAQSAKRVTNQSLIAGAVLAAIITTLAFLFGGRFVALTRLGAESAPLARLYLAILLPVIPAMMLEIVGIACLRGAGDTVSGFITMSIVNVVNILVGASLVIGLGPVPRIGWAGLPIGTACGHAMGGLVVLVMLIRGRAGMRLHWDLLRPDRDWLKRILRIGFPGGLDQTVIVCCHLWFLSIINSLGTLPAAAHGLGVRIESLAYLPGTAFQVAAATLAGQFLGAGDPRRATRSVMMACAVGGSLMMSAGVLFYSSGHWLTDLFLGDATAPNRRTDDSPLEDCGPGHATVRLVHHSDRWTPRRRRYQVAAGLHVGGIHPGAHSARLPAGLEVHCRSTGRDHGDRVWTRCGGRLVRDADRRRDSQRAGRLAVCRRPLAAAFTFKQPRWVLSISRLKPRPRTPHTAHFAHNRLQCVPNTRFAASEISLYSAPDLRIRTPCIALYPHARKMFTKIIPTLGLVLLGLILTGCGTTKSKLATEQLIMSDAVDRAVARIDFRPLGRKKVFLDTQYMRNVKGMGFVNADYIISSLRQQMVAAHCLLEDKVEDADYVVEARVGALGADSHDVTYGIPPSNSLSSAASLVPNAPSIPAIPEISLAKKSDDIGAAKIAVFAYHRESKHPVWQSGVMQSRSTAKDTWLFGAGPFQSGTIRQGTGFAGEELDIPLLSESEDANRPSPLTMYNRQVHFVQEPEHKTQDGSSVQPANFEEPPVAPPPAAPPAAAPPAAPPAEPAAAPPATPPSAEPEKK